MKASLNVLISTSIFQMEIFRFSKHSSPFTNYLRDFRRNVCPKVLLAYNKILLVQKDDFKNDI